MRTVQLAAVAVLLAVAGMAHSQVAVDVSPKAVKLKPPPYAAISFTTEGPAHSHSDGKVRGKYQRIVVLSLGLAYAHPTLRLETLTYGDEVCCRRLVAAWELDRNELPGLGLS